MSRQQPRGRWCSSLRCRRRRTVGLDRRRQDRDHAETAPRQQLPPSKRSASAARDGADRLPRLSVSSVADQKAERARRTGFASRRRCSGFVRARRARYQRGSPADGGGSGDVQALVGAQIVTGKGGAQVGAAITARVSFAVDRRRPRGSSGRRRFSDHAPATWVVPLLLVLALGGWQLRRRFKLDISRRAGPPRSVRLSGVVGESAPSDVDSAVNA